MKTISKTWLYFTRSERRGLTFLAALCLLLFWLPTQFKRWYPKEQTDFSAFQQEIAAYRSALSSEDSTGLVLETFNPNIVGESDLLAMGIPAWTVRTILKYREKGGTFTYKEDLQKIYNLDAELYEKLAPYIDLPVAGSGKPQKVKVAERKAVVLEKFNPNTATKEALLDLGIPERIAQTLLNYRNKGGSFRNKEDLRKVYGFSEGLYQKVEPYIHLDEKMPVSYDMESPQLVDINSASVEEWRSLRGIGPVLSERIVKFRDKLGGFTSVAQVGETYGLADSTFQRIAPKLLASSITKTLAINRVSEEKLRSHPYIDWRQAKAIVNYRKSHGSFTGPEDWNKLLVLSEEEKARMLPYLSFE